MEVITYINWTEPGEKKRFEECVKTTKNDAELREKLKEEFNVDTTIAFTMIRRFKKIIKINRR